MSPVTDLEVRFMNIRQCWRWEITISTINILWDKNLYFTVETILQKL